MLEYPEKQKEIYKMNEKKIAAFFDIDGTIYREGLITEVFKKFITHELISESKWYDDVRPAYMKWDRRQGEYDDYLLKMTDIFKETTKGLSKEHVEHIARKVIAQKGDRVYIYTRDAIKKHQEAGHIVIAISGSPYELVNEMAKKYNFDDWRGTIYETDQNGIYTGTILPMWDHVSKEKALKELVEKYNIDLDKSYAYGDTMGDLTMLSLVAHPTAINPTHELLMQIKQNEDLQNKIDIIVERKDVMYKIDPKNMHLIEKNN